MRERAWTPGILILITILVTACSREEPPVPTPAQSTVTVAPTAAPTPADAPASPPPATPTPEAPTPVPTATPAPLPPSATPAPAASPTPTGGPTQPPVAPPALGDPLAGAGGEWELTVTSVYTSSTITLEGHQIQAYPAQWRFFILADFMLASLHGATADLMDAGWFSLIDQSGNEGNAIAVIATDGSQEMVARYAQPILYEEPLAELAGTVIFDVPAVAASYTLQVSSVLDQFLAVGLGDAFAICTAEPDLSVLTLETLLNSEYEIVAGEPIQLEKGFYSVRQPDSTMDVMLMPYMACDRLPDGREVAAAVLISSFGTTVSDFTLVGFVEEEGKQIAAGAVTLGTNLLIRGVSIDDETIVVDMLIHGELDPDCCPSVPDQVRYGLVNGQMIEQ